MSSVRVRYSGLVAISMGFGSVATGVIYALIITRMLEPEELGMWSLIGGILGYFLVSESLISYWSVRQIARENEVGRTALASSTVFSFGLVPVYLVYVMSIADASSVDRTVLMLGVLLLPAAYIGNTLNRINTAHMPQAASYGNIIFASAKIPLALAFVAYFDLGVEGAIITVLLAHFAKIAQQAYYARSRLRSSISLRAVRFWLTNSWISLYHMLPLYIYRIDSVLFLLITNSVIGLAYYHVAVIIARLIYNASHVFHGLYPKLLSGGSPDHAKEIFTLTMYFAIPLLALTVIFSKPALFALNPLYADASLIVILFSIRMFFHVPIMLFEQILKGVEGVDIKENPTFKELLHSGLFSISTVQSIRSAAYIGLLVGGLAMLSLASDQEYVIWWAIAAIVVEIPVILFWWNQMRKRSLFSFPASHIAKYSAATVIFVMIYHVTSDHIIVYHQSIYAFLPGMVLQVLVCVGAYAGVTYATDKKIRRLVSSVIREIRS